MAISAVGYVDGKLSMRDWKAMSVCLSVCLKRRRFCSGREKIFLIGVIGDYVLLREMSEGAPTWLL